MEEKKSERKKQIIELTVKALFNIEFISTARSWKRFESNLGGSQESFTSSDISGCLLL